nr:DUF885 domain-containing protein [Tessaracoccus coleopterorum]
MPHRPTQDGGIYYTGPTADFSRAGRMWWSVPPGVETFSTWQERTTVYHEGVPGHHLQIGQAVYRASDLNKWRSLLCWVSGHGEGWALYAERLMADLGFQDDPGDRMGMLDSQRLRAARVVLDIGVHLGKPYPGGGTWNVDSAWSSCGRTSACSPTSCASSSTVTSAGPGRHRRTRWVSGCGSRPATRRRPARVPTSTSGRSTAPP